MGNIFSVFNILIFRCEKLRHLRNDTLIPENEGNGILASMSRGSMPLVRALVPLDFASEFRPLW